MINCHDEDDGISIKRMTMRVDRIKDDDISIKRMMFRLMMTRGGRGGGDPDDGCEFLVDVRRMVNSGRG